MGETAGQRLILTATLGLISIVLLFLVGSLHHLLLLPLLLFIVIFCFAYFSYVYPQWFMPLFFIAILLLLTISVPLSLKENMARMEFLFLGVVIVITTQVFFLKGSFQDNYQWMLMVSLHNMQRLHHTIFSYFLEPELAERVFFFEKILHMRKNNTMYAMNKLRRLCHYSPHKNPITELLMVQRLENLYEIILASAQLRSRVNDHTVFSLCEEELSGLQLAINESFRKLINLAATGKKAYFNGDFLLQKIKLFEDNYHNVLQVAAQEPFVFMLFLHNLYAMHEVMNQLANEKWI